MKCHSQIENKKEAAPFTGVHLAFHEELVRCVFDYPIPTICLRWMPSNPHFWKKSFSL